MLLFLKVLGQLLILNCYMSTMIYEETKRVEGFRIYYFNATSLRGKLHQFNSHFVAINAEYDIISISESWLNEGVFEHLKGNFLSGTS